MRPSQGLPGTCGCLLLSLWEAWALPFFSTPTRNNRTANLVAPSILQSTCFCPRVHPWHCQGRGVIIPRRLCGWPNVVQLGNSCLLDPDPGSMIFAAGILVIVTPVNEVIVSLDGWDRKDGGEGACTRGRSSQHHL
jgi:hypothetical protein